MWLSALILVLFSLQPMTRSALGASPGFCDQYAKSALAQLQQAQNLGIPGLNPPVWSNDYTGHYSWCLTVPEAEVTKGAALRQAILNNFSPQEPSGKKQGSFLPKPLEAKPVQGKILLPPGVENICAEYAKEAVSQQQYNLNYACGQKGPEWDANYSHHFSWCIHGENYKLAPAAGTDRNALLSTCTATGCPLIAPGMTLGLRHSRNNPNDTFMTTDQVFNDCSFKVNLTQLKTTDVQPGGFGKAPNFDHNWHWTSIVFQVTKSANQYPLPPGVVIGLSGDEFTSPTAFGILPYHGPEYLPGNMFRKATGGDLGRGAGKGLYWYESTGVGFTDWTSINRLPRGTIVALRHSDSQSLTPPGMIGSLGGLPGKLKVQKIVWQGKTLDPHDPKIQPPPGFVVKHSGDLGADSGHGYSWYEKTTGP